MPPTNDPAHRHSKPAPRTRRKSKPKFEIPAEAASPATPVAWVYRKDEVSPPPSSSAAPPPLVAAPHQTKARSKSHPIEVAGVGLFFAGAATLGFVSLVALGLVAAPLGVFSVGRTPSSAPDPRSGSAVAPEM
jgi:hypothetical protein